MRRSLAIAWLISVVTAATPALAAAQAPRVIVLLAPASHRAALADALRMELAGRNLRLDEGDAPVGTTPLARAAAAQATAQSGHDLAAIWVEQAGPTEGAGAVVRVVSAYGNEVQAAPVSDPLETAPPRLLAVVAASLVDELVMPPNPPVRHQDVDHDHSPSAGGDSGNGGHGGHGRAAPSPSDEDRESPLSLRLTFGVQHQSMSARAAVYAVYRDGSNAAPSTSSDLVQETHRYESSGIGHFEGGVEGVFYPGALGHGQPVPWFGIVGRYSHSLGITTLGCASTASCTLESVPVHTSQDEIYFGARGRFRLGHGPKALRLLADLGWGDFSFLFDTNALMRIDPSTVVPPVSYTYVGLGLGVAAPVAEISPGAFLTLKAHGAYRLGLGIGQEAKLIWGVDTGSPSGFEVGAGVQVDLPFLAKGVFASLDGQFFRFTTTYRGQTGCEANGFCWEDWPSNPPPSTRHQLQPGSTLDPNGGIEAPVDDTYYRLGMSIGYAMP